MKKFMKNNLCLLLIVFLSISGCKKFVEIDPPNNRITSGDAFASDVTATAALSEIYSDISNSPVTSGLRSVIFLGAISADELRVLPGLTDQSVNAVYMNANNSLLNADSQASMWIGSYAIIFKLNAALAGLEKSQTLTPVVKKQLVGEVKFMRAFCYFYLVNIYGDVPLVLDLEYAKNSEMPRSPKAEVYKSIESDLLEAKSLLSENFLNSAMAVNAERTRPTTWAASALLARVYLYLASSGQSTAWANAEAEASRVISQSVLFDLTGTPLSGVFLKNSKEAIFQLQPVRTGFNTQEGLFFILPSGGPSIYTDNPAYFTNAQLSVFDSGDPRLSTWIKGVTVAGTTYYYPFKYQKNLNDPSITSTAQMTEYSMVLRLAEQYLIRAEARAMQNKLDLAISDLNTIRSRARSAVTGGTVPANYITGAGQQAILTYISKERRLELFTEWGDRWLNIKRNGTVDEVMTIAAIEKGSTWNSYQQLYPIPETERKLNTLLKQNPGYE